MRGKNINISSYQLSKTKDVPVKSLDFRDEYIMMGTVRINCKASKMCYNFVKHQTKECISLQLFSPGQIFVSNITLRRICQMLDDLYYGRTASQKDLIPASLIDFYDGYIMYNGRRIDCKRSKFKYNSFKKLSQMPNPHYRDGDDFLMLNALLDALKECDELTSSSTIKAYFSEKVMQLGPNNGLRIDMAGDFSFLRYSYKKLPGNFVRRYIDKGCDLNELPLYILHVNSESIERVITPVLDTFMQVTAYDYLFGKDNLPDKKLNELFCEMRKESVRKKFIEKIQTSMLFSPVTIDHTFYGFTINIKFDEWVQNGGSSMKENCSFKPVSSKILVDLKQKKILLLSESKNRSVLLFGYKTNNWQMVTYFLISYFSSECRYKRSILPLSILNAIGINKITKAYRTAEDNCYISGNWFAIMNRNSKIQQRYYNELVTNQ